MFYCDGVDITVLRRCSEAQAQPASRVLQHVVSFLGPTLLSSLA